MLPKSDKTSVSKTIWDRIALLRENSSLAEFCNKAGWNYRTAQKSYQRQSLPDWESLIKISSAFQVDLRWLASGEIDGVLATAAKKLKLFRKKKGWSLKLLEEKLGAKSGIISRTVDLFENGNVGISMDLLHAISNKMGIAFQEFLHEDEPVIAQVPELKIFQASSTRETPQIRNEDYVSIPLTASAIAAGQPIITENDIEDYVLLHIRAAGKRKNLVACKVDGVSMEPMLHSGDIVVIDRDDRKIAKNKMYAVFYEEGLTAKYVERQKDLLILRPINPNAQVQVVNLVEHPDPIVGRIIGAWKEL